MWCFVITKLLLIAEVDKNNIGCHWILREAMISLARYCFARVDQTRNAPYSNEHGAFQIST